MKAPTLPTVYLRSIANEPEDLILIERAGRRCSMCNTGRHWRRFEVTHPEGRDPVILCAACSIRFAERLPVPEAPTPRPAVTQTVQPPAAPPAQSEDRLKRALRELPAGEYSTERIAKAAGLNSAKVFARLQALQDAGEVQQIGKHWSTVPPATDLEAAFERLKANTGNLRIVRERERVS